MALVLSNVTTSTTGRGGTNGVITDDHHGLRLPLPKKSTWHDMGSMDAAYSDARVMANQFEDQLTRALQVRHMMMKKIMMKQLQMQ